MATDLERAFNAIKDKRPYHQSKWEYYDGDQALVYSTERLKEIFRELSARFNQNWCAVVVDSVLDRLTLNGFETGNSKADDALDKFFKSQHMELDADDVHTACQVTGEAFIIVGGEGMETEEYYNDPRLCHMFYESGNPKRKEFAAKWWVDSDNKTNHMVLYYPDKIERYISEKSPSTWKAFKPDGENSVERHDYGEVPVFHFRNERRRIISAISNAITIQDAINKLFADMMVSAEFGAFKQRWAITNANVSTIKSRPGTIIAIPPSDGDEQGVSVGEFSETDLGVFFNGIDKLAKTLSIITRVPKSYIMDTGAGISGDALLAMEAPLVKKTNSYKSAYSVTWEELASFLLKQLGYDIPESDITSKWDDIEATQPFAQSQTRKTNLEAGIPLVTQLRNEGWSDKQIEVMLQDQADEKERNSMLSTLLLEQARTEQEQSNDISETS